MIQISGRSYEATDQAGTAAAHLTVRASWARREKHGKVKRRMTTR
jgi:hypothetical protein